MDGYARNQSNVPLEGYGLVRLNPYATIGLSCVEIRFLRRLIVVTQFLKSRSFNAVESCVETLMRRYTDNPMEENEALLHQ